ncbi:MAG: winged helix-turn-helix domain-containing protein [Ilumatobacteraceae bacterium]
MATTPSGRSWTFLTNHAHILLAIASSPEARVRDLAELVGVTERTAMQIIDDLEADGYVTRERVGRRNRYQIDRSHRLRHPLEKHHEIDALLQAVTHAAPAGPDDTSGTGKG